MDEIASNRLAWDTLAEDHYRHYKERIERGENRLNMHIREELGDLAGKRVAHLQCNVGFDTLALAESAARVTGVDLAPENVRCAQRLAEDFGIGNVEFVEADVCDLPASLNGRFDVAFTSEGVLGWLPDLDAWARGVRRLLVDGGFLYVFDSHPFSWPSTRISWGAASTTWRTPTSARSPTWKTASAATPRNRRRASRRISGCTPYRIS